MKVQARAFDLEKHLIATYTVEVDGTSYDMTALIEAEAFVRYLATTHGHEVSNTTWVDAPRWELNRMFHVWDEGEVVSAIRSADFVICDKEG